MEVRGGKKTRAGHHCASASARASASRLRIELTLGDLSRHCGERQCHSTPSFRDGRRTRPESEIPGSTAVASPRNDGVLREACRRKRNMTLLYPSRARGASGAPVARIQELDHVPAKAADFPCGTRCSELGPSTATRRCARGQRSDDGSTRASHSATHHRARHVLDRTVRACRTRC